MCIGTPWWQAQRRQQQQLGLALKLFSVCAPSRGRCTSDGLEGKEKSGL